MPAIRAIRTKADILSLDLEWQAKGTFPDWKGYTDDTLAMNSMYSFFGYHGQGVIYLKSGEALKSLRLYVNGIRIDTAAVGGGGVFSVDISSVSRDGENTIQVSNIVPFGLEKAVTVFIPYPEILPGELSEAGISPKALDMISRIIESDIKNGFSSAQLAVIRNGRLVYENAWGRINAYLPDGRKHAGSPAATEKTLYDLASVTKMFSVNYALQKLVTDGMVNLDSPIRDFLGEEFVTATKAITPSGDENADKNTISDLSLIKAWKETLTIRDLLRHQGGFPADPRYYAPYLYIPGLPEGGAYPENPLYAGNGADEATKLATIQAICRTPLDYEPGTKTLYSDLDYMILGLVVEKVTGEDLNTWLKKTFWEPIGLTRITYNPLQEGFAAEDCAATELNGNTRDRLLSFPGYRTYTLQGEVHDEKAYYSMRGISGHAGLFANASDLAVLSSVMLCGGYGNHRFFSRSVLDQFTAPKRENAANWGLGWQRQGEAQRVWHFGTQASSASFGHQGWTGTLAMIDPERRLVVVYLTNRINSPLTNAAEDSNRFNGNWYTAGTLGFVPQILSLGMDTDADISAQLLDLAADMARESLKLIPENVPLSEAHPSARNAISKRQVFESLAEEAEREGSADTSDIASLRESVNASYEKVRSEHKGDSPSVRLKVIAGEPVTLPATP